MPKLPVTQFPDAATDAIEAACQAMAITIARQDGVELSAAGYRHARALRPNEHRQMREYVQAGLEAAEAVRVAIATPTEVVEKLRDELLSAACLFETLSEGMAEDSVPAIMMRTMAERNRAALAASGNGGGE